MFDFWIILTACIIAINSSLLGSFLVLKKMSLIGDALSHAVLPGIVIAFLISGEINSFWMLLGASGFGIVAILLIDWLNRVGGFGKDSSIGIIYTLLFAVGIILITSQAQNADIDVDCVLFGDINTTPMVQKILGIPTPTFNLLIISIITIPIILSGLKGFKITSFDKGYAQTLGISIGFWSYLLLGLSSISTVFSFDSVGAIMVIGLLVIPASLANILTRKLKPFLAIAVSFAILSCIFGHLLAIKLDIPTVPTIGVLMGIVLISTLALKRLTRPKSKIIELTIYLRDVYVELREKTTWQKQAQEKEDVKKDSPIKNGSFGKTLLWKGIKVPVILAPDEKTARTFAQLNLNKLPNYPDKSKSIFVWNKKVRFIDLSKESNSGSEKRQKKKVKIVLLFAILAILSTTLVYLFFDNDLPTKNNLLVNNEVDSLKQTNNGESAAVQGNITPNAVNEISSNEKLKDGDFHANNQDTSKKNNQVNNLKISFAPNKIDSTITEEKFNDTVIQVTSNKNISVPDETYLEEQRSTLNKKYHIILGCYDVKRNAKNELDRITSEGIAEGHLIKRKDKYFVVRHSFETSAEGYSSLKKLRIEGVDCWLLKDEFNYSNTAEGKYEDESKKSLLDKYHVIVGCFDIKQNAKNQQDRVANDGINDASIIEIGNRYFVAIKSFSSSKKGYKSIEELRLQGLDCWLLNHN